MVRLLRCSFCGRTEKQVPRLLAGAKAYICDDCVRSCTVILEKTPPAPLGEDALLASLAACDAAVDVARDVLQKQVDELRARQASWEVIGAALGISRQSAWERFH